MRILKSENDLTPGKWYAVGFEDCGFGGIDWGGSMLYRYDGDGCWSDDDGEPVELTLDPVLQFKVPVRDADAFAEQNV